MDDLDDLLARRDAREQVGPDRSLLDGSEERPRHVEVYVGLEKDAPNLAQGLANAPLAQPPPPQKLPEHPGEAVAQLFEHGNRAQRGRVQPKAINAEGYHSSADETTPMLRDTRREASRRGRTARGAGAVDRGLFALL